MKRVATWLKPGGLLFVHIFVENALPYHFVVRVPACVAVLVRGHMEYRKASMCSAGSVPRLQLT